MIPVLSRDDCLEAFRKMLLIRRFEEACIDAAQEHKVPGHFHVYIGQEATGVGVASVLDKGDYVHSTHRNHGHLLARGADPKKALAEILGKATGYAGGKAGTLHGCAPELNFPLSSGIVAGILPISTGTALAFKHRGEKNVSAVFFGEGAMEEGAAYEALNLAALWKLPVLFICENNLYGEYSPLASTTPVANLTDRAGSYAMPAAQVDGNDVLAVRAATSAACDRARAGEGPTLIEALTYRFMGHSRSDPGAYRPQGELDRWRERDPIPAFERVLAEHDGISIDIIEQARADGAIAVSDALERALGWPEPDPADRFAFAEEVTR
jgi:TPP-dependent pyruvate/acetoin dehydrogenase alpha subunit